MSIGNHRWRAAWAALALLTLAGCGSSDGSSDGSSGRSAAASGTAAKTATSSAGKPKTSGGLQVDTTPKFATPSKSQAVKSGTVHVAYRYITIQPDTLRVKVGTTVVWTNYDSVKDDVTSIGASPQHIASKPFGEGESFEVKLTRPGTIHYESTPYPTTMNGTIEVLQ